MGGHIIQPVLTRAVVFLFLLLPLMAGCVPKQRIVEERPLQTATLEELLQRLTERTRAIETVRALLTVRPEGRRSFTASMTYNRDSVGDSPTLRLTGFDLLGRSVLEINAEGESTRITVPRDGRMTEVPPDHPDLDALPVQPRDFLTLVAAVVGPVINADEIPVFEKKGHFYIIHLIRLEQASGRLSKRLWIDRRNLNLTRIEIFGNGGTGIFRDPGDQRVVIILSEFEKRPGLDGVEISWPGLIQIESLSRETLASRRLDLVFREIHINEKLSVRKTKGQ